MDLFSPFSFLIVFNNGCERDWLSATLHSPGKSTLSYISAPNTGTTEYYAWFLAVDFLVRGVCEVSCRLMIIHAEKVSIATEFVDDDGYAVGIEPSTPLAPRSWSFMSSSRLVVKRRYVNAWWDSACLMIDVQARTHTRGVRPGACGGNLLLYTT
jgi:hypothetical protein